MESLKAFLQLIRWQNLVFIALTQLLFLYCIERPLFVTANLVPNVHGFYFVLLVLASVAIAAAGNIINDYFDLNIDHINKPQKVVVDKVISRRMVIVLHLLLSFTGIGFGFYIDYKTSVFFLGIANFLCVLLLFFYSASLKKKFLIGNILISLLTAWVILVITYCETNHVLAVFTRGTDLQVDKLARVTLLFAGFAFIISLIREVVKDMEDVEGDRRYGCKTMPIVWGINATKVFVAVWLVVIITALIIVQVYVLQFRWWWSAFYCIVAIIFPLIYVLLQLFKSHSAGDFHRLSNVIKLVMLTGILSMIFFKFYF